MRIAPLLFCILASIIMLNCSPGTEQNKEAQNDKTPKNTLKPDGPNIIIIYADDMGYGDLACFGATDIKTPNIDRLANEGMKFTEFYSASPVCSPSRAALLTGRYPQRMGINYVFFPESFTGMSPEEVTIAEVLKEKGYTTGIVGKWHLGHHCQYLPLNQGFDSYFGIPYSNDMASIVYMRDNKVVDFKVDQTQLTKTYTKEALSFIEKNKHQAFFLYMAHNMPHVPLYASDDFLGSSDRGLYGDVVQEIDWSVGQILKKLEESDLLENTLVIFSSDNGPWLVMEDHGGSAGILHQGKQYTFEGGMRVPTLAMWKSKIPEGSVYDDLATMMDWMPTITKITNATLPQKAIDGVDISNVMLNNGKRAEKPFIYFNGERHMCYRKGNYKVKLPFNGFKGASWKAPEPPHDTLLIDLKTDPGERHNLYTEKKELAKQLFAEFEETLKGLGELPQTLVIRSAADKSHYEHLKNK